MVTNKIFVFVGMLLVGLLMFGLVSGAGYNVVVPSTTPPSTGGSSGGGGGGVVNVTDNETVVSDDVVVEGDASADDGVSDSDEPLVDIGKIVDYAKDLWVLFSVVAILVVVALVVYFKKLKKS